MTHLSTARTRRLALAAGIAGTAALGAATVAPAAQAAPFSCSATPISGEIGPQSLQQLSDAAGIADGACTTKSGAAPSLPANPLITGGLLTAKTTVDGGTDVRNQSVTAEANVGSLSVGSLAGLGLTLPDIPTGNIPATITVPLTAPGLPTLPAITIPGTPAIPPVVVGGITVTPGVPAGPATTIAAPTSLTIPVGDAIRQLILASSQPVLQTQVLGARATARCIDGSPRLAGDAIVAPAKLFGIDLPADGIARPVVVDTSQLNLTQLQLAAPIQQSLSQLNPAFAAALQPALSAIQSAVINQITAGLPASGIPISALQAKFTAAPAAVTSNGVLTQDGPSISLSLAGNNVISVRLGRATVGAAGVSCAPDAAPQRTPVQGGANSGSNQAGTAPSAAQQLLQCSERRLVLTNVIQRSNRVALFGVADKAFAGQTVTIKFRGSGQDVATAKVLPDGTFQTTAPLPSRTVRGTNKARYQARIGSNTSLDLKLQRRMTVTNLDQANGTVTVKGKLVAPLPTGGASVLLSRRVSCNKFEAVKRVKANRDGSYEISVPASAAGSGVVYRLQSKVRNNPRNPKTFRTYTLPQGIDINA